MGVEPEINLQRAVHDLRNPLTNILGSTELLLMQAGAGQPLTAKHLQRLRALLASAMDMDLLLVSLGEFDLIRAGERGVDRSAHSAAALAEAAVDLLVEIRGSAKVPVTIMVGAGSPTVLADRAVLTSVLHHLLSEGLKLAGRDGHVSMDITREDAKVRFEIHVRSPGLAPEEAATPDANEPPELGIRLAFSRAAINLQGGELTIRPESRPDSTDHRRAGQPSSSGFTVLLPAAT